MTPSRTEFNQAIEDFREARQKAAIQEILARLTGKSTRLLSYEEVAEKLKLQASTERGLRTVPVDAIVGSVGRYTEFSRSFLPLRAEDKERWARVRKAYLDNNGTLPAIELYKVGDVYFVIDGNHRVSVARQEGSMFIEAHVIEVHTSVNLTPNMQPEDLIIPAEYVEFIEATNLIDSRPNVDLSVTACGQYEKLLDQIRANQYILQEEHGKDISLQESAENWYDTLYIPLAEAIRDRGLLRWFPDRTITDLYLWISENRSALEKELGWEIHSDITAIDLILENSVQSELGTWRKARTVTRYTDHLFTDILVPLSGDSESWDSLEQAIFIAQHEGARIHGLHVVRSRAKVNDPSARAVQTRFHQMCSDNGVDGKLVIESGNITRKISERATMTDLIVLKIVHPPRGGLSTLNSPFRAIITNSSRPILGVPSSASQFQRALLAYDGGPRSKEALFVATYLAEMWKTELVVFTSIEGTKIKPEVQDYVRRYLDIHEVEADFVIAENDPMVSLRKTVEDYRADLILIGSYSSHLIREIIIGSSLDYMLRESAVPIFICR
jgi:nucleotide-binding universal stress UspA family protein